MENLKTFYDRYFVAIFFAIHFNWTCKNYDETSCQSIKKCCKNNAFLFGFNITFQAVLKCIVYFCGTKSIYENNCRCPEKLQFHYLSKISCGFSYYRISVSFSRNYIKENDRTLRSYFLSSGIGK